MKPPAILASLLALALTLVLAACMPETQILVLTVSNNVAADEINPCLSLSASVTNAMGTSELNNVDPGEHQELTITAPDHVQRQAITVEAWCETTSGTDGYAKLEGTLMELNTRISNIRVSPPDPAAICGETQESVKPAPCINTNVIH